MAPTAKTNHQPTGEARVTMYDVEFGDCFLLAIPYTGGATRHLLIDCGTHKAPRGHMLKVAQKVAEDCGGKLDAIVATHRHSDHISAFGEDGPGEVFAKLKPDLVVQPWTEDPEADSKYEGPAEGEQKHLSVAAYREGLLAAQEYAAALLARLREPTKALLGVSEGVQRRLEDLAGVNIYNKAAVAWLEGTAECEYVHAGCKAEKLLALLPGVGVRVLGPPTLKQTQGTRKQASHGPEFWKLQKAAVETMAGGKPGEDGCDLVLPGAPTLDQSEATPQDRWVIERVNRAQVYNVQWIVTSLKDTLNNTSIILLLEVGHHRLLFAGDAQVENWSYALSQPELTEGLGATTLYKVGHHGSGNATPKSLWDMLTGSGRTEANPLFSLLSTEESTYPRVPCEPLVEALAQQSTLHKTQTLRAQGQLSETVTLP
ncbi:hypothetical protein LLH03_05940 [bacterium]|nr:hypothetical protein [bacterium]